VKNNKLLNKVCLNFRNYKLSYTIFLWGLSGVLYILGNKFGMLYLVLGFLPILTWAILFINERQIKNL